MLGYTQSELNDLAKTVLLERISVPGVQPKLSLHLERARQHSSARLTLIGLAGDYILKPQSPHWPYLPEAEHFAMLLARKCNISTAEFGLIPLKSGELSYLTKRMDRPENRMLHMEDFAQILNKMTEQKYHGSMEQIGKALRTYSNIPGLDIIRFFELAIYCFLIGNSDMHLKNFSLLETERNHWELSPAYDLVPVNLILPQDPEEMALTLNGKKNRLQRRDFETFGKAIRLSEPQIKKAIQRMVKAVEQHLSQTLAESFLPQEMQNCLTELIHARMARL